MPKNLITVRNYLLALKYAFFHMVRVWLGNPKLLCYKRSTINIITIHSLFNRKRLCFCGYMNNLLKISWNDKNKPHKYKFTRFDLRGQCVDFVVSFRERRNTNNYFTFQKT